MQTTREDKKSVKRRCPTGLQILSAFNYVFAIFGIFGLVGYVYSQGYGLRFNLRSLTFLLSVSSIFGYFVSANGYLSLKWLRGYITGNISALAHLSIAIIHIFAGKPLHPELTSVFYFKIGTGIVYPVVTIILLNIVYRWQFFRNRFVKEKSDNDSQLDENKWHF